MYVLATIYKGARLRASQLDSKHSDLRIHSAGNKVKKAHRQKSGKPLTSRHCWQLELRSVRIPKKRMFMILACKIQPERALSKGRASIRYYKVQKEL